MLTREGLKQDPDKVKSITQMKVPEDRKALQRFLGMVTYLSKFVPKLSELGAPINDLIKKDNAWMWDSMQQKVFEEIKSAIANPPVLKFYVPVTLSWDSSQSGIGAVSQNGIPIAYASRAMNPTQQRYTQIKKELLAIQFGCEKFGHTITVERDHKPLEMIFRKPLQTSEDVVKASKL